MVLKKTKIEVEIVDSGEKINLVEFIEGVLNYQELKDKELSYKNYEQKS